MDVEEIEILKSILFVQIKWRPFMAIFDNVVNFKEGEYPSAARVSYPKINSISAISISKRYIEQNNKIVTIQNTTLETSVKHIRQWKDIK